MGSVVDVLRVHATPIDKASWLITLPECHETDKWPFPPLGFVRRQIQSVIHCVVDMPFQPGVYTVDVQTNAPDDARAKLVRWCEFMNTVPHANLCGDRLYRMGPVPTLYDSVLHISGGKVVQDITRSTGAVFSKDESSTTVVWGSKRQIRECKAALERLVEEELGSMDIRPNQAY